MIHLYAFASGIRRLPAGTEAVDVEGLAAIVGPGPVEDPVRHGLVVQALLDDADAVVPARFGERFADVGALRAAVAGRADQLHERLDAVAGCVEVAVRVARPAGEDRPRPSDGAAYMRARLRAVAAEEATVDELHAALTARARAAVVERVSPRVLHGAGYLVERSRVDEFAKGVAAYAAEHPELSIVCTGPWPPSSFAGAA